MSGWFPCFSPDGKHLASGNVEFYMDGQMIPFLYTNGSKWIDNERCIHFDRTSFISAYHVNAGMDTVLKRNVESNMLTAGGGRYAWFMSKNGRQVFLDNGTIIQDALEPAIWGEHLAYLLDGDAQTQRLIVDGEEKYNGPITNVRANQSGYLFNLFTPGELLAKRQVLGATWVGRVENLQPSWETVFLAIPIKGPDGDYILAYDNHRLLLVKWGTSIGWTVYVGETFFPDAVWTGEFFKVAWSTAQGVPQYKIFKNENPTDVYNDEFRPPLPTIKMNAYPLEGSVPFKVVGAADVKDANTWRWLYDGKIHKPDEGSVHDYLINTPGKHTVSIRASGPGGVSTYDPPIEIIGKERLLNYGQYGVQCGYGELNGTALYQRLRVEKGWQVARIEASDDKDKTRAMIDEVIDGGMTPIVIARETQLDNIPEYPSLRVELYNEPNGGSDKWPKLSPAEYVDRCERALYYKFEAYFGSINNISREALAWLAEVIRLLPEIKNVSYHRYPQNDWDVATVPRKGYSSRADEFRALKAITENRNLMCTEFGWHNSPFKQPYFSWWPKGPGKTRTLTEQETHDRIRDEFHIQRANGVLTGIVFQRWEQGDKKFGIMHEDDSWKLQSNVPLEG